MIITCPACSKKYSIKSDAVGPKGRTVKCKNCGHKWHQSPPGAIAQPAPTPTPPPPFDQEDALGADFTPPPEGPSEGEVDAGFEAAEQIADPPPIPEQLIRPEDVGAAPKKRSIVGWLVFLVILVGLGAAAVVFRTPVMTALPGTAPIFALMGFDVPYIGQGFDIRELPAERIDEDGVDVLIVRAEVANVSEKPRMVPIVRIELLDLLDRVVQRKDVRPPEELSLAPGELWTVETKIRKPNPEARKMRMSFIDLKTMLER